MKHLLDIGCYIDGAIPRTDAERIEILQGLLTDINPSHPYTNEIYSNNTILNYSSEILDQLTDAINRSLVDYNRVMEWEAGDLILRDLEDDYI